MGPLNVPPVQKTNRNNNNKKPIFAFIHNNVPLQPQSVATRCLYNSSFDSIRHELSPDIWIRFNFPVKQNTANCEWICSSYREWDSKVHLLFVTRRKWLASTRSSLFPQTWATNPLKEYSNSIQPTHWDTHLTCGPAPGLPKTVLMSS